MKQKGKCNILFYFTSANSAAAGAGLIWFFTYLPVGFLARRFDQLSFWYKLLPSLLCNTGMSFGFQIIMRFEGRGGVRWSTIGKGTNPQDDFSLLHVILMLLLDALLHFCAAIYIEGVWPGEYGVKLTYYFPFTVSRHKAMMVLPEQRQRVLTGCLASIEIILGRRNGRSCCYNC